MAGLIFKDLHPSNLDRLRSGRAGERAREDRSARLLITASLWSWSAVKERVAGLIIGGLGAGQEKKRERPAHDLPF